MICSECAKFCNNNSKRWNGMKTFHENQRCWSYCTKKKEVAIMYRAVRDLKIIRGTLLLLPISYVLVIARLSIRDNATSVENQTHRTLSFRSTITFYMNFERLRLRFCDVFATKPACAKRSSRARCDRWCILVHCAIHLHIAKRKWTPCKAADELRITYSLITYY